MNSLNGQGDNWNFFARDFSNKIPPARGLALWLLEQLFKFTRKPANHLPIDHLAEVHGDGSAVSFKLAPEQLVFRPTEAVKTLISPNSRNDFRVELQRIPAGTRIYEVIARADNGNEFPFAYLETTSAMVASNYGDKHLFFQHKR